VRPNPLWVATTINNRNHENSISIELVVDGVGKFPAEQAMQMQVGLPVYSSRNLQAFNVGA